MLNNENTYKALVEALQTSVTDGEDKDAEIEALKAQVRAKCCLALASD